MTHSSDLHDALESFETALETPCVPGSMEDWTASARASFEALHACFTRQLADVHSGEFDAIESEDPNLGARVQQLRREDEALQREYTACGEALAGLVAAVSEAEPDEASLDDELSGLIERGIALVIRTRKQELAARTWLIEALDRDIGEGD